MYGANPYHGVLRILYKLESDFYRNDRNKSNTGKNIIDSNFAFE